MLAIKMAVSTPSFLVICACLLGVSKAGIVQRLSHSSQAEIVDSWIADQPGGAVAVAMVSPSETEYFFGGKLSPDNNALPNDRTIFEVGSITKGFTGLLLADQVLSGNVYLNETLSNVFTGWLRRFKSKVGNVTLLELSTHSAGFPRMPENMNEDPYIVYTRKELFAWLDTAVPFQRGTFSYSNAGVATLGQALAANAGKTYEELVKEKVLKPIGLLDATITLNDEQQQRVAPPHGPDGQIVKNYPFEVMAPAGAMKFSVAELVNFLQFTTGLKRSTKQMEEALELATRYWGDTSRASKTIGLNWMRLLMPQDKLLIWHNGVTPGFNAYVGWVPERQLGVVVLASVNVISNNTVEALAMDLLKLVL